MYFYRAMSVNEYLRFLDGEKITCEGPKGASGNMCMMPGIIDVKDVGIVDVTTFYKNAMTDVVNPEMFVKFEINDYDLYNLIESRDGYFLKMPYHFGEHEVFIEELQLKHYDNTFCKPVSVQLWNSEFSKNYPTIDANDIVRDTLRVDAMFQHARGDNGYIVGIDFSYSGARAFGYDFSNITSYVRDDYIGQIASNYNQIHENIEFAEDYVGLNRQFHSDINFYILKEFQDKYYFSNQEFGDYEKFFHSENIVRQILEYKNEELNENASQIIAAMKSALNSDKRFFINSPEGEVIASRVNVFETDNFVIENITHVGNEYHIPVWKVQSKDSKDFAYLDTELVMELCKTESIKRFMLDGVERVGSFQFTFKDREFESYSDMLLDAQNTFGMTVNDIRHEVYQKLFNEIQGTNESDLFLYKIGDCNGLDVPKISFNHNDFVISIDNIDNPQKVIISKNNHECSSIAISNDEASLTNILNIINSVNFNNADRFCSIVNNCIDSGYSIEKTKEIVDKIFGNASEHTTKFDKLECLRAWKSWESEKNNLVDMIGSNCGDNWGNIANHFLCSGFNARFSQERGLTLYNSDHICDIKDSEDGYLLKISPMVNRGEKPLIVNCDSIEEAILKIKDECCEEYSSFQGKYPGLAKYDSYGLLLKTVEDYASEYKEVDNKITMNIEPIGSIEIEDEIISFYKRDSSGEMEFVKSEDIYECTCKDIKDCGIEKEEPVIVRRRRMF